MAFIIIDAGKLAQPAQFSTLLPKEKFYSYPNPVVDGIATVRYFLGDDARSVHLVRQQEGPEGRNRRQCNLDQVIVDR